MKKVKYLTGFRKKGYENYIKIYVFIHFFLQMISGKFPSKNFIRFLKRLLFFLSKMKDNKYVKSGKYTKLNLYVPAFPSKAFFKACRKVIVSDEKMPCITVLLSITSACRYRCDHCYQKKDRGKDVDINLLCDVTKKLDKMGVSFFNIEGGEPFLVYDRLKKVCESIETGEIWINSTGDRMTPERLEELKSLGVKGIMFSLHSYIPAAINAFFKRDDAWDVLVKGIEMTHKAGLEVAVNTCILRKHYYDGTFDAILDKAKDLGVSIMQLIKPKPSGGWLNEDLDKFSREDLEYIENKVKEYNNKSEYREYPFIAAQISEEKHDMFGCTAGGTDRFYINAKGDVQPCEFLNISYGNIEDEKFEDIYDRMRKTFETPGDNWICETCSSSVSNLVAANDIKVLPLCREDSEKIIQKWDRGNIPDFYKKVKEI